MTDYLQVSTSFGNREQANALARELVYMRLAACAQVTGPLQSTYWWRDRVEHADEWLCTIKTTVEAYPALERAILERHPYDTPEILATPIVAGSRQYLEWLSAEIAT